MMIATIENDKYRRAVAESWDRCKHKYDLARENVRPLPRLQSTEVTSRLEAMVELTGGRRGIFSQLSDIATRVGHCLLIVDTDRFLVRLESTSKERVFFERNGIALGSCWNERFAGTNGIDFAMSQLQPVTVRGKDHFLRKLSPFACTAIPLYDARNEMIGAANLSTIDHGNEAEYLFAKKLIEQAARQVQQVLFEQHYSDSLILSICDPTSNGLLSTHELIAVDASGFICGSTNKASSLPNGKNTVNLNGQSVEAITGFTVNELTRDPGKVLCRHFDSGSSLNVSVRETKPVVRYQGKGWHNENREPKYGSSRRRLPPSLQDLSIGSRVMADILEQAQVCFNESIPCLIEGESGTGKTELVRALNTANRCSVSNLVSIDCAALEGGSVNTPDVGALLEHARIAQTLRELDNTAAVLALENIGEMPGQEQAMLKNLLDTMESDESASTLNIIATSQRDLRLSIQEGKFREDLYYLLAGARFILPPLRQREGRERLARTIASKLAGSSIELTDESAVEIQRYDWPGNVRELRNVIRQALIAGNGTRISPVELSKFSLLDGALARHAPNTNRVSHPTKHYNEKTALMDALLGANWNVTRAANNLGIARATMHRKMKQFDIRRPADGF